MTDAALGNPPLHARPGTSDAEIEAAARKSIVHRHRLVLAWRFGILAAFLGLWEVSGRLQWIDPFFYATPSAIAARLYDWTVNGTSEGPLWFHLWVTMEEAILGFVTGSVAGI